MTIIYMYHEACIQYSRHAPYAYIVLWAGGGLILFDEFANWAIMKNLDLDDDVDMTDMVELKDNLRSGSSRHARRAL